VCAANTRLERRVHSVYLAAMRLQVVGWLVLVGAFAGCGGDSGSMPAGRPNRRDAGNGRAGTGATGGRSSSAGASGSTADGGAAGTGDGGGDAGTDGGTDGGSDAGLDAAGPGGAGGSGAGGSGAGGNGAGGSGAGGSAGEEGEAGEGGSGGGGTTDPCEVDNGGCHALVTCSVDDGEASCGPCPTGYEDPVGDGRSCNDIDECAIASDLCDDSPAAACANTTGSYTCTCPSGYADATTSGRDCQDIDECAA
jgi:hypothetical protein